MNLPLLVTPLVHNQLESHSYHKDETQTDKETNNKYLNKPYFPLIIR